jgi:hypothetical protein
MVPIQAELGGPSAFYKREDYTGILARCLFIMRLQLPKISSLLDKILNS